jgi:hypothetical protein
MAHAIDLEVIQSPSESEAFGIKIGRFKFSKEVRSKIDFSSFRDFDCIIIDDLDSMPNIEVLRNIGDLRYAGTIMYWVGDSKWLESKRAMLENPVAELLIANKSNIEKFIEICLDAFDGYVSHYSYSPLFSAKPVNVSYADWIARTVSNRDCTLFGYEINGSLASFALCQHTTNSFEVLLAGTALKHRKSGAYTALIGAIVHNLPPEISQFRISTQATNVRVQRLWSKYGLVPLKTITRYHLWVK